MWEKIDEIEEEAKTVTTDRLKVPGGWIVRTIVEGDDGHGLSVSVHQVFIGGDHRHGWDPTKE